MLKKFLASLSESRQSLQQSQQLSPNQNFGKPELLLKRVCEVPHIGNFGLLLDGDFPVCITLEREWINNEKNISCIPPGVYDVEQHQSYKHGKCFSLEPVNGRTNILIHKGNWAGDSTQTHSDTQGCILVGRNSAVICGQLGIAHSNETLQDLLYRYKDGFTLQINGSI